MFFLARIWFRASVWMTDFGPRSRTPSPAGGKPARFLLRALDGQAEGREIRTPNLLIWSQTRCRCAIPPIGCIWPASQEQARHDQDRAFSSRAAAVTPQSFGATICCTIGALSVASEIFLNLMGLRGQPLFLCLCVRAFVRLFSFGASGARQRAEFHLMCVCVARAPWCVFCVCCLCCRACARGCWQLSL